MLTIRKNQEHEVQNYVFTKVVRVTQRTIDKRGRVLLIPESTVEGWWSTLDLPEQKIIKLYENLGLSEQFHSEFKSDLDLERLPSGKLATNALIMALGCFAYNILRLIGQLGLHGDYSPIRHPAKQRRLKTVMQEFDVPGGPTDKHSSTAEVALQQALSRIRGFLSGLHSVIRRKLEHCRR